MWFRHWRHPSDRTLTRVVDAELAGRRATRVERHLAACPACVDRLRQLSNAADSIRSVVQPERSTSTDCTRLRARLHDRMSAAASRQDTDRQQPPIGAAAAQAAVLVTAVLIAAAAMLSPPSRAGSGLFPETLSPRMGFNTLPDASLTPGSVLRTTAAELCAGQPRADRTITPPVRQAVLRAYGMEDVPAMEYELDFLVTPELGGANDRENLWPERYGSRVWNARVKDDLERLLPRMVCEGRLELEIAQRDIAVDWIAAYKKYFHASAPLTTYSSASDDDDPQNWPSTRLVALNQLARR